ncbi:alanine racemase [Aeromicrobium sp.]
MTGPQAEAVVDLDAYRQNLVNVSACAPNSQLMAVVKANAYGHGMAECARAAREAGADWLGVATVAEARSLRESGDTGDVLCWLASPGEDFAGAIEHGIQVTASGVAQLDEILAATGDRRAKVQLKADTGLSRNGAYGEEWLRLVDAAATAHRAGRITVTGVWSHLACADEPEHRANDEQEKAFREAISAVEATGLAPGLKHLSNSAATLTRPSAHFDLVRVGIASYGISPDLALAYDTELTPVMTLRGHLAAVKRVAAGSGVSYGHTYYTRRETTLGLVPMGYGDGVSRTASNRAEAQFAGVRVPVAGTICMDQLVVDLGDADAKTGDPVTLFGPGTDGEPSVSDWAEAAGTIGYEVVTRLGGRIEHTYRGVR